MNVQTPSTAGMYTAAVRANLSDLPAEVVSELTEGLEANLAEAATESGRSLWQSMGDPCDYANELRVSAGLPPREEPTKSAEPQHDWLSRLAIHVRDTRRELRQSPMGQFMARHADVLHPLWWAVRGLMVGVLGATAFGTEHFTSLMVWVVTSLVASILLGVHRPKLSPTWKVLLGAGNALLIFLFMIVGPSLGSSIASGLDGSATASRREITPSTLYNAGEPVRNVFAYDSSGNPLVGVQLFDQNGRPLNASENESDTYRPKAERRWHAYENASGAPLWNAYPLWRREGNNTPDGQSSDAPTLTQPGPPRIAVGPITPPTQTGPRSSSSSSPTKTAETASTPTPHGQPAATPSPTISPSTPASPPTLVPTTR